MADPVDVAGDIAADAARRNHLVGPAGKEALDHATAAGEQPMGMAALRHALARNVGNRKCVALQKRDAVIEIRKRPGRQQARHARPDHNRMFADPLHGDAPCPFFRRATADTAAGGA